MCQFDMISAVVNVIAVALSPIIVVLVGQFLQNRKDKMLIVQCLMTNRMIGWTDSSSVNALNLIDIVFSYCEPVRAQ